MDFHRIRLGVRYFAFLCAGVMLGAAFTNASDGTSAAFRSSAPIVISGSGKEIGYLVPAYSSYIGVLVSVRSETMVLPLSFHSDGEVKSTGLNWLASGTLYQSGDCTGEPYLLVLNGPFGGSRLAAISRQRGEYVANVGADSPVRYLAFHSVQLGDEGGCRPSSEQGPAVPVGSVIPLKEYGPAPFHIR